MDSAALDKALAPLVEFPLPPAPSLWPQTWAGRVLLALIIAGAVAGAWTWLRQRRANRYRREAIAELQRIERRLDAAETRGILVPLESLLRRVALVAFPRDKVASLVGADWRDFLDRSGGGHGFDSPAGRQLTEAAWRPAASIAPDEIRAAAALVRHWIEKHHV
ncbi:DUF4381 domain-containing protein [Phreatobacter stygius]|nr:DUF4381 domain-containing protein [Phreatobacter stygius]